MNNKKSLSIALVALVVACGAAVFSYYSYTVPQPQTNLGRDGGPAATACTASSSVVAIGHQQSKGLLATSSRRAWATVEQPVGATNTVAVAINDKTATAAAPSFELGPVAASTSPVEALSFGLNTDFSYTGAVKAITSNGSTTVKVTECTY